MLSRFFIHRPIFAAVISIVIVLAGSVSLLTLPTSKFPEIAPPTVQVTAVYPGANATVVADTVAQPIEQEINGVEGSIYYSSTCTNDGTYTLTVTFDIGTDMDMAQVLVQNRVAIAEAKLPEEVRRQGITTKKQSTQIVQFITLSSDKPPEEGGRDALDLSNFASIELRDELARVRGVGQVTVFGVGDYAMRIWLDPGALQARKLTTDEVIGAIREQNVQVAAGQVGGMPTPQTTAYQLTINTKGRLETVEEFENIIVKTGAGGRITRISDIARVQRGSKEYKYDASFNGQPCAAIAIYQLPGSNALEVAEGIRAKMADLSSADIERGGKNFAAQGIDYDIPFDTTRFVTASIDEVFNTLFVAVALVVLVIFVFLQDWRATIVPVAAIPVSLVGTFAIMAGLDFSLNMLTLFGIVLAIGIVVDDAIVVVENTSRHLDDGCQPKEAAVKAMDEITGPVIATTLVLLAVFVPTAFMGGITGQLYRQFALTISGAVVISTLNALTLSPALCGLLLRPSGESWIKNFIAFRWFNGAFDVTTSGYRWGIGMLVRRVGLVMIAYAGLLVVTGMGFVSLPSSFMPTEDQGYVFANVQLPDAASLPRTQRTMQQFDEIIRSTPGVSDWVSVAGYSMISGASGSNQGMIFIIFEPWDERTGKPNQSQEAILAHLQREFSQVQESIAFAFVPPPIDGLGAAGGFQMQILQEGSANYPQLQVAAEEMVRDGNAQTGLANLNATFRANAPQLFAEVDRTAVKTKGVPLSTVFSTLQAFLGAAYVNDYNDLGRTFQVKVQADEQYRTGPEDIDRLQVRNNQGEMIAMSTFVDVQNDVGPPIVQRYLGKPTAQVNGAAAPGFSSGQALALMEQMAAEKNINYAWTGMSYQEKQAGGQVVIFTLAVVFVFLVLAAQYESWTSPAAVVAVVPLAALGVVVAVMLAGADSNTYTQIGIVLLVALASKNAILIVEFARDQRKTGMPIREAATQAAELRFRAILMTAFSSILGFIPLLLATGAGAASRVSVGLAVVGGMVAATIFSLVLVPNFFVLFQGLQEMLSSSSGQVNASTSPPSAAEQDQGSEEQHRADPSAGGDQPAE